MKSNSHHYSRLRFSLATAVSILLCVGGCGGGTSQEPGDADGLGDAGENVFADAESLSCPALDLLWHSSQDDTASDLRSCSTSDDCVLVPTSVDCKPITGADVEIAGCDTAIATTRVAEWNQDNSALDAQLCAVRTLECVSTSNCPEVLTAMCISSVCTAL